MADKELIQQESAFIESADSKKARGWYMKKVWSDLKSSASNIPAPSPEELNMFFGDIKKKLKYKALYSMPYEWIVDRISMYFQGIVVPIVDTEDQATVVGYTYRENPSMNGLGLYLNIDRQTLHNYCQWEYVKGLHQDCDWDMDTRRAVFDALIKARQLIEGFYEKSLAENRNPAGLIYWLNNQKTGWSNQIEVVSAAPTGGLGEISSPEEIQKRLSGDTGDANDFPDVVDV